MEENTCELENTKEVSFDITMDETILYDYLVHHAYSGASGILGTCFGVLGIMLFINSQYQNPFYLILGVLLIFYLPVNMKFQAKKMMVLSEAFKSPLHYKIDVNGITVSQGEAEESVSWDKCIKAVSTKQSILVYTGKKNATIFPRKQLGEKLPAMIATLAENMPPERMKIRF